MTPTAPKDTTARPEVTRILRSNLMSALSIAIGTMQIDERAMGYTGDSGFVAGLREVLEDMRAGARLEVRD